MSANKIGYTGALADVREQKPNSQGLKPGEAIDPDTGLKIPWVQLQERQRAEKEQRRRGEEVAAARRYEEQDRARLKALAEEDEKRADRLEQVQDGRLLARIEALEAQLAQLLEARKPTRVGRVRNAEVGGLASERSMSGEKLGSKLFGDSRLAILDDRVRTTCTNAGLVNVHEIQREQAAARAKWQPVLKENPSLSTDAFKELVIASERPAMPAAAVAERVEHLVSTKIPVYETRQTILRDLAKVQAQNRAKPALNAVLNGTGAGTSMPLARLQLGEMSERRRASAQAVNRGTFKTTTGKP